VAEQGTIAGVAGDTGAHGLDAQTGVSSGIDPQTGLSHVHEAHHGRPASWVAVSIIIVGFIVSGVSMVLTHQAWWLFWTGGGIIVIGGIMALSAHILDDWY
jgi:hypothetical protein